MKALENQLERMMFASRWLLTPFYIGLVIALLFLIATFVREMFAFVPMSLYGKTGEVITAMLALVDIVMVGNLILLVVFAGYENFVSKIHTENSEDRPEWMGTVTFSDLKMKLMGTIVAISGIDLLKSFINVKSYTTEELSWRVGIHLTFVVSGVLFALMDRLSHGNGK
jgi:uncharacterized protein (TIGR00645 family)